MTRLVRLAAGLLLALLVLAPAALAATPDTAHSGRILIATDGDITVPAGDRADLVVVVNGTATIDGIVHTVVVVDGSAVLTGAKVETLVAIRGPVMLGPGTVIGSDLYKLDALVTKSGDGDVRGSIRDIGTQLTGVGFVLAPLFLALFAGFVIAGLAFGLLVAALGARQVRAAELLMTRNPVQTFVVGLAATILPVLLIGGLFITVVGIPLALGLLFVVWPLAAFLGYIVAGIWIGDWVLERSTPGRVRERPYLATVVGLIVLAVLGVWPFLSMVASLFGYGAVVTLAWRTFHPAQPAGEAAHGGTAAAMPA